MSSSLKTYFILYKTKVNSKGLVPVIFRIKYHSQTAQISTGYSIKPKDWIQEKSLVKNSAENAAVINQHLKDLELKTSNIFSKMFHEGDIYLGNIIDKLRGKEDGPVSLLNLITLYNNRLLKRVGVDIKMVTYKKYQITEKKLVAFLHYIGKKDIRLKELKQGFIEDFNTFMKDHYGNNQNTTGKHLKNLKSYIAFAVSNEWLTKSPFSEYRVTYRPKEKPYLSLDEIHRIEQKQFDFKRIKIVKDLFLFQCYTGLSFSDLAGLKGSNVTTGIDGGQWIIKNRLKTEVRSAIPLLPKALDIILFYNSEYKTAYDKPLLPNNTIQKYNSYLKEIADMCGINKVLSSHAGRRTFASTVALSNGISIESISQMLGHTSTKITHQYARVTDMKVAAEMEKIKSNF
jgi:integrase